MYGPQIPVNDRWAIVAYVRALQRSQNARIEDVQNSYYVDSGIRHPYEGVTEADHEKEGAYSWCKAPRYHGEVMEVGPLARMRNNFV